MRWQGGARELCEGGIGGQRRVHGSRDGVCLIEAFLFCFVSGGGPVDGPSFWQLSAALCCHLCRVPAHRSSTPRANMCSHAWVSLGALVTRRWRQPRSSRSSSKSHRCTAARCAMRGQNYTSFSGRASSCQHVVLRRNAAASSLCPEQGGPWMRHPCLAYATCRDALPMQTGGNARSQIGQFHTAIDWPCVWFAIWSACATPVTRTADMYSRDLQHQSIVKAAMRKPITPGLV